MIESDRMKHSESKKNLVDVNEKATEAITHAETPPYPRTLFADPFALFHSLHLHRRYSHPPTPTRNKARL